MVKCYHREMARRMKASQTEAQEIIVSSVIDGLIDTITTMGEREFANQSGIKEKTVSAFVRGDHNFKAKTLDKCLSVFGLSPLFTGYPEGRRG